MAESPVINFAARILREVATGTPADVALREALKRTRHRSAPAERRDVSRAVFTYFRWVRWLSEADSLTKQLEEALALQQRFNRDPALFKPETLAARAVPDWLANEIPWPDVATVKRPYPTELGWLRQLQREPVLWIRAKAGLEQKLAAALGHCAPPTAPGPDAPFPAATSALCYTGPNDLFYSDGFQTGEFEIQDLASQLVSIACAPQPGQTWWDACAGEGGKMLHLADLMQGKGIVWASDRSIRRLAKLKERAARAKVFNYRVATWEGGARLPTKAKFDGVLVDAPCTGIGTWQRNPHARWTVQPHDVQELGEVQTRLLDQVAASLKPGGRLIYSVCTLTRAETTAVAEKFTAAHPDFEPAPVWTGPAGSPSRPETRSIPVAATVPASDFRFLSSVFLWPQQLRANGMFIAAWRKK
jgi:16S rRNA (cytosine967-C5)-methyltransferase